MSQDELRQLLSSLPEDAELAARAARARRGALARLEQPVRARGGWLWAPALAVFVLVLAAGVWANRARRVEPLLWSPPAPHIAVAPLPAPQRATAPKRIPRPAPRAGKQERLELHLALSDGTRVQWIFDKNFSL